MEKYNMEMETALDTIPGKIMNRIQKNSVVLEFGCAYGRMTKYMKEELQCQVYIVELDPEAYAHAIQYAVDGYCGDIETEAWYPLFANCTFDYILFADVLEHLKNPEKILSLVKTLLGRQGEVIISIPNIAHFDILANLYLNRFQYTKIGLLDDTHIHFWAKDDLDHFALNAGYQIIDLDGVYIPPYETEQCVQKDAISEDLEKALQKRELNDLYQFFLVLKKGEEVSAEEIVNRDKLRYFYSYTQAAIYFDFGEGYCEEHSIRLSPTRKKGSDILSFDIQDVPSGCKKIRFDPIYGEFSVVCDLKIVGNNGTYKGTPLNGVIIDESLVFANTTPHIEIELREATQWMKITASIESTYDTRWISLLTELQTIPAKNKTISSLNETVRQHEEVVLSQVEALQSKDMELQRQTEALQSKDTELQRQTETLQSKDMELQRQTEALQSKDIELQKQSEELQNKKAELTDCRNALSHSELFLQQLQERIETLQSELDISQNNFAQLNKSVEFSKQELNKFRERFHSTKSFVDQEGSLQEASDFPLLERELIQIYEGQKDDIDHLTSELNHMTEYARHVESLYHQLALQYNTVLGSRCWRMTAPLRHFLDFLKDKLKIRLVYKAVSYVKHYGVRETYFKVHNYLHKGTVKRLELPLKIESFTKLTEQLYAAAKKEDIKIYLPKILKSYDNKKGKKILLVSHELNLTGGPVAIYYFACVLKENGYFPVIVSPNDGKLTKTVVDEGIPVIVSSAALSSDFISSFAQLFQLIVLNTIVTAPVLSQIDGMGTPVFWWVHEAQVSYTKEHLSAMPPILPNGIFVYAGGSYAKKMLEKFRPEYDVKQMLYYVPDHTQDTNGVYTLPEIADGKLVFCIIGMLEERKGQNILADAILCLPEDVRSQSYFVFIGRQCFPPNYQRIMDLCHQYPENVYYIEELDVKEIHTLYKRMDCLICASLDDPMPIVVTEALEYSKLVICSEYTGSAELLLKEQSGLVYQNNDPEKLAACITYVAQHEKSMNLMREAARHTYEKYFSQKVFEKNVLSVVEQISCDVTGNELPPVTGKSLSMSSLIDAFEEYHSERDCIYAREVLLEYDQDPDKKRILLITHECSLTGAPIALQSLAESFKKNDVQVVFFSPFDGPMVSELVKKHMPILIYSNLYGDQFLAQQAVKFDLVVLSTVVTYRAVTQLQNCDIPVLWWIHDSRASYEIGGFGKCLPPDIPEHIHIYCGGEYAQKQLLSFYPHYHTDILYYVSPDESDKAKSYPAYPMKRKLEKLAFTIIGQQDTRKGHDIFAKAITLLSDGERDLAQFYFIGGHLDEEIQKAVDEVCELYPQQVTYIPQVNRQELFSVYAQSDCIVCSSRDDPMPIFVTEALMMSKTVICSEHTGWSPILERENCGLVYYGDEPEQLAEQIRYVLSHNQELAPMRKHAREIYLRYFSEQAFETQTQLLLTSVARQREQGTFNGIVSVIIPTYNAGAQFEILLQRLQAQKKVRRIEIIIIDSGSTDETERLSKQYGVRYISISHESFTHSYARNKGAGEATGDLLLFMTQDALPLDEYWMYHLAEPIMSGQAVAVSCMEQCPEETDLYYKVASWNHANYQGILQGSRFSKLDPGDSIDDLRAKASLNDVTSMIRADVFSQYLYRFGYAEDLDMGLRLLKAGYTIGLLNATASVHGHSRAAGYYMKRGFVESKYLGKICELWKTPVEDQQSIARQVTYSYGILNAAVSKTYQTIQNKISLDQFFDVFLKNTSETLQAPSAVEHVTNVLEDPLLQWCITTLASWSQEPNSKQETLVHHIAYYVEHILRPYMEQTGIIFLNLEQQKQMYDCIEKQLCLAIGCLLAGVDESSALYSKIQNLASGV